jgi:hypothetical protein
MFQQHKSTCRNSMDPHAPTAQIHMSQQHGSTCSISIRHGGMNCSSCNKTLSIHSHDTHDTCTHANTHMHTQSLQTSFHPHTHMAHMTCTHTCTNSTHAHTFTHIRTHAHTHISFTYSKGRAQGWWRLRGTPPEVVGKGNVPRLVLGREELHCVCLHVHECVCVCVSVSVCACA